jgi:chromosomal replication initiation ATPase DnaA
MIPQFKAEQLPLEFGHTASQIEDDFIAGEGNALALAHVRSYPAWPHPLTLLIGPAKSGKSHLGGIWALRAGADTVTPHNLAIHAERPSGPLLVEDIDRAGFAEAPLFHLVNRAMRENRPLLMTAREPIANWPFATDDLKSRARLAAHFTLALSDDIQLAQMFVKLFGDRQISVEPKVIAYMVKRMERSSEEVVALAELTDRLALAKGTAITRSIAAAALAQRGVVAGELDLEGDDDE